MTTTNNEPLGGVTDEMIIAADAALEKSGLFDGSECGHDRTKAVTNAIAAALAAQPQAGSAGASEGPFGLALNVKHKLCHQAADAFWSYWRENGETHKRGYYESTWGAINRAIQLVGVVPWTYGGTIPAAPPAQASIGAAGAGEVKAWQERCDWTSDQPATKLMVEAMKAELADLRAQLARQQDSIGVFAIEVEKLLCDALGREWSVTGISIESLITELARQRQGSGEPARYEHRMRAPNGHCGEWSACNKEFFDRFSAAPDIGDGFAYQTRALYEHAAPQAQGEPVASTAQPTDEHEFIYFTAVSVNGELLWREVDADAWKQAKGVLKRTTYVGPYRIDLADASAAQSDEVRDAQRYQWLANRVLACDYGDNDAPGQKIGWRIRHDLLPVNGGRQPAFMFGASINEAIDAALRATAADSQEG